MSQIQSPTTVIPTIFSPVAETVVQTENESIPSKVELFSSKSMVGNMFYLSNINGLSYGRFDSEKEIDDFCNEFGYIWMNKTV